MNKEVKSIFILSCFLSLLCTNTLTAQSIGICSYGKKINKIIKKNLGLEIFDIDFIEEEEFGIAKNDYYTVKSQGDEMGYLVLSIGKGCSIGGCANPNIEDNVEQDFSTEYESFVFMTLVDLDQKIKEVRVLEYDSDYGYEICSRYWLKQFRKQKGCTFEYNNDIDAISGATVSGQSITSALKNICYVIDDINRS